MLGKNSLYGRPPYSKTMRWNKKWALPLLFLAFLAFVGMAPQLGTALSLEYPASWPEPTYPFETSPLTEEGVALGRSLFYDPILSLDSTTSCANCHLSYTAFTHVDHALSHGIGDSIGTRNSMALMNLAWSTSFMWDGAVNHLDMQALAPITHPDEMGEDIGHVVEKLKQTTLYPKRFGEVFGTEEINGARLLKALAQFQLTLISANSKYDKVMREEEGIAFTDQEEKGYHVFQTNCESCHQEPLFTNGAFENNGLPVDTTLNDGGRIKITGFLEDSLRFKVPTLRNVEFSFPYMHDGRFKKLFQVMDHYENGIHESPTLSPKLKGGVSLTSDEKVELVAFLLTLTDKEFLFNRAFAFPRN